FILGAFLLFFLAYFLLARQLAEHDSDTVRVKLEAYRAWYIQGGVAALQLHFKDENDWEKATTFLEVRGSNAQVVFNQRPGNSKDNTTVSPVSAGAPDTISLPKGEEKMVWTIAKAPLPDGCIMRVGRATEDRDE